MRINRQLPPMFRGLWIWIDGERHLLRGGVLCGAEPTDATGLEAGAYGALRQDECCPRCWQRWRREEGVDVRNAWREGDDGA
jgi:hypothetical protein